MFHEITDQQIEFLQKKMSVRGSSPEFCKRTGIRKQVVSRILSGNRRRVNGDLYALLFPEENKRFSPVEAHRQSGIPASVILDISEAMAEFAKRLAGIAHAMNMKKT